MARKTEITLAGIGFNIRRESQPEVGNDGKPIFGQSGLPKMVDVWVMDLIEQRTPTDVEVIHVLFDDAAKDKLVTALTGGILVTDRIPNPNNGGI